MKKSVSIFKDFSPEEQIDILDVFIKVVNLCVITNTFFTFTPEGFEVTSEDGSILFDNSPDVIIAELTALEKRLIKLYELLTGYELNQPRVTFDPVTKTLYNYETTNSIKPSKN